MGLSNLIMFKNVRAGNSNAIMGNVFPAVGYVMEPMIVVTFLTKRAVVRDSLLREFQRT